MISKIAAGRSIVCPCLSSALAAQELVGAARPHTPGVSGATRPRTPRFTFGRPKVNRKTAKTNGFGFLFPIGLYQVWYFSATEFRFDI